MSITRRLFLRHAAVAGTAVAAAVPVAAAEPSKPIFEPLVYAEDRVDMLAQPPTPPTPYEKAEWHMRELEKMVQEDGGSSVCVIVIGHPHNGAVGSYTNAKLLMINSKGAISNDDGMFASREEGGL